MKYLAFVVAVLVALLIVATIADARSVPRGWLGVQVDGPLTEPGNPFGGEWDLMAASGVETVRAAFDWRAAQPAAGGPIDFSAMDAVVVAGGGATPAGAAGRAPARRTGRRRGPGEGAAATPRGTAAYTAFLRALVGRYGPRGSLWAEQPVAAADADPRLADLERAEPHALLVLAAVREVATCGCCGPSRRALRAADPGSRTVLAGLPNESWIALRQVYKAGGRGAFDAVALHPYTGSRAT